MSNVLEWLKQIKNPYMKQELYAFKQYLKLLT